MLGEQEKMGQVERRGGREPSVGTRANSMWDQALLRWIELSFGGITPS